MTHLGYEAFDIEYEERQTLLREEPMASYTRFTVKHFEDERDLGRLFNVADACWEPDYLGDPVIYVRRDRDHRCASCATDDGGRAIYRWELGENFVMPSDIVGYIELAYGEQAACDSCEEMVGTMEASEAAANAIQ